MNQPPLVSVKMLTYNHEKYIRKAIEGVVSQHTNFKFELIIGEDCSTDKTRTIVFDMQKKYPDIIKVLTSESNVGMKKNAQRINRAARGKYFAYCEGDDYWTDPQKLQMQVEILDTYPEISLCCHALELENRGRPDQAGSRVYPETDKIFSLKDMLRTQFYWNVNLVSVMIRAGNFINRPDWVVATPVGDVPNVLFSATKGDIYYIGREMATYATYTENSWNDRYSKKPDFRIKIFWDLTKFYNQLNAYTENKYNKEINAIINKSFIRLLIDKDFTKREIKKICTGSVEQLPPMSNLLREAIRRLRLFNHVAFGVKNLRKIKTYLQKVGGKGLMSFLISRVVSLFNGHRKF